MPRDPSTSLGMTELLLATRNAHKTRELAALLGANFVLRDLTSTESVPEIVESGNTFAENAVIKALAVSHLFPDEIIIADDSGLEVEAIAGAPGVRSARYAGERASDEQNIKKLLSELSKSSAAPSNSRGLRRSQTAATASPVDSTHLSHARFCCVVALAKAGKAVATFSGTVAGNIVAPSRGRNGFGYDPIFVPQGFSQTFAELPPELKNRISHRARAARKLARFLKTLRL